VLNTKPKSRDINGRRKKSQEALNVYKWKRIHVPNCSIFATIGKIRDFFMFAN